MDGGIKVWWGADCIVSSLGFGTRENMEAVRAGRTNLAAWHDGTPVCLIDRERLAALAAERGLAGERDAAAEVAAGQSGNSAAKDTTELPADAAAGHEPTGYTLVEQLVLLTLGQVVAASGLSPADSRTLIVLSTTKGNIDRLRSDPGRCDLNRTAQAVGAYFGAAHRPLVVSNACISGVSAIVIASRLIRSGAYDHVFVAGFDMLCDFIISGFNAFKSVSPTLCRPYDAARDGLTLGEACGAVLLTRDEARSATGVTVAGGGISNDANHISAPSRTGDGLWYAIRAALAEAEIGAGQVGLVNPHGTATVYNDEMESRALQLAGLCDVPCNSLKPYFGHTLGASGVVESIVTVRELCEGVCFGVKGYTEWGVPYPLDVSAAHREIQTDAALKTASGFGGCNAAAVFRRAAGGEEQSLRQHGDGRGGESNRDTKAGGYVQPDRGTGSETGHNCRAQKEIRCGGYNVSENNDAKAESGQGVCNIPEAGGNRVDNRRSECSREPMGSGGNRPCPAPEKGVTPADRGSCESCARAAIRSRDTAHVAIAPHPAMPFDAFIRERYRALAERNLKFSKMDDLCKLAYVASCELLSGRTLPYPAERIGVVLANRSASLDSDRRHQAVIDAADACGASPAVFVYTLPNIMLGQVAIRHGMKGEGTFLAFPDKSSNFIREYAASLIAQGRMDAVLWGWCEFYDGTYDCEMTLTEKTEEDTMEDLELQLKQQIIEALNLEEITAEEIATDAPLFGDGLGLDSIDALEITLLLERHYGIRLANPAEAKPIFYSVATLADYIRKNRP